MDRDRRLCLSPPQMPTSGKASLGLSNWHGREIPTLRPPCVVVGAEGSNHFICESTGFCGTEHLASLQKSRRPNSKSGGTTFAKQTRAVFSPLRKYSACCSHNATCLHDRRLP